MTVWFITLALRGIAGVPDSLARFVHPPGLLVPDGDVLRGIEQKDIAVVEKNQMRAHL